MRSQELFIEVLKTLADQKNEDALALIGLVSRETADQAILDVVQRIHKSNKSLLLQATYSEEVIDNLAKNVVHLTTALIDLNFKVDQMTAQKSADEEPEEASDGLLLLEASEMRVELGKAIMEQNTPRMREILGGTTMEAWSEIAEKGDFEAIASDLKQIGYDEGYIDGKLIPAMKLIYCRDFPTPPEKPEEEIVPRGNVGRPSKVKVTEEKEQTQPKRQRGRPRKEKV